VISRNGVTQVLNPSLSNKEVKALKKSAAAISNAMAKYLPGQR
jgi:malate/lactate dehydrogenase